MDNIWSGILVMSCSPSHCIQGGQKKTTPNFGGHFDLFPEKQNIIFIVTIKGYLFGISCENVNDIAFTLFKI